MQNTPVDWAQNMIALEFSCGMNVRALAWVKNSKCSSFSHVYKQLTYCKLKRDKQLHKQKWFEWRFFRIIKHTIIVHSFCGYYS